MSRNKRTAEHDEVFQFPDRLHFLNLPTSILIYKARSFERDDLIVPCCSQVNLTIRARSLWRYYLSEVFVSPYCWYKIAIINNSKDIMGILSTQLFWLCKQLFAVSSLLRETVITYTPVTRKGWTKLIDT